ncbi:MAG: hypothetical protein S4CHLAM7_13550 [Chlamydiae bacterium]|nr:hypothetical protein [Chlamydiota bacterium]
MKINPTQQDLPMIEFTEIKQKRLDEHKYAEMDKKTLKIRQKLEKRLDQIESKITQERISETKEKIQYWINRHSSDRTQIKKESFTLFTEGKEAAPISRAIANIRKRLESGLNTPQSPNLRGRVKKTV